MHRQLCSFLPALGPLAVAQRFICAAFAVIGLLVGVAPRTASAQATSDLTRRTDPYFNMIYVPCSGETVALSGQMVETYHDVREPSGNVQGIIEFRLSD